MQFAISMCAVREIMPELMKATRIHAKRQRIEHASVGFVWRGIMCPKTCHTKYLGR